jgi:hypothetical protein
LTNFSGIPGARLLEGTGADDVAALPVLPVVPLLNVLPLFPVPFVVTHVDEFALDCTWSKQLLRLVVTAMTRTIQRMRLATPTNPRMMPARAMPLPLCRPPLSLICFLATNPKITARIEPIPNTQTIPSTNDATESPFVVWPTGGGP